MIKHYKIVNGVLCHVDQCGMKDPTQSDEAKLETIHELAEALKCLIVDYEYRLSNLPELYCERYLSDQKIVKARAALAKAGM